MTPSTTNIAHPEPSADPPRLATIDFDVHQSPPTPRQLLGHMPERWQQHLESFGLHGPREAHYTVISRHAVRSDSWPEKGVPGSDLELMREQLLDRYDISHAILGTTLQLDAAAQPRDLSVAMTRAANDWTRQEWLDRDDRLLAAICSPFEYAKEAIEEIERRAGDRRFVSVLFNGRTERPLGHPKYWDIFEAAEHHELPVEVHVAGVGGNLMTGAGVPTYYIEGHVGHVQDLQYHVISLVLEGVFERFPKLQVVLVEGGFSWVGPLKWRLDRSWEILRDEVPRLTRRPSEYVEDHFWFTTQPMEEPPDPALLNQVIDDGGLADRLLFSTDYPHWDFDAPDAVISSRLRPELRDKITSINARKLLRLP